MTGDALDRYGQFLAWRDGIADIGRGTLARREAFFAELAARPVRAHQAVDDATYRRHLSRRHPEARLPPRLLWVLAAAKANQAERFAVGVADVYGCVPQDCDAVFSRVHLQERYHTRILSEVASLFGLPVDTRPPRWTQRTLIGWLVSLPPRWTLPLTGFSEMVGCAVFWLLRDTGVALFADDAAVATRIKYLFDEILADEVSHANFAASLLSPRRRALMYALYRSLAVRVASQQPELVTLVGSATLARYVRSLDLAALAAELAPNAYCAAEDRAPASTPLTTSPPNNLQAARRMKNRKPETGNGKPANGLGGGTNRF